MRRSLALLLAAALWACGGDDDGGAADPPDAAPPDPVDAAASPDADPLMPGLLSESGLYADLAAGTLAEGVREYEPRFALWSDGATKKRWIYLPAGEAIDTSDMDFWSYPVGTRLWKEFSKDGMRVETRLMIKTATTSWHMISFAWNDDESDAVAVPDGRADARGTTHDIPSQNQCDKCHRRMPDHVLGFRAIQLDHDTATLDLAELAAGDLLTVAPPAANVDGHSFPLPGDATAQAALGYMHGNCGGCHNARSPVIDTVSLQLFLEVGKLATVEETPTYVTGYNADTELTPLEPQIVKIIDPGSADTSVIHARMNRRDQVRQMPPLSTDEIDTDGLAAVTAWINSLPPAQ